MSLCIAAGGKVIALAVSTFTLSWTHSVEHAQWWERWAVSEAGLRPVEARIRTSGAGMEPPEGAVFRQGAWHYTPHLPPMPEVLLAASGVTGAGWQLCAAGGCLELGEQADTPIRLWTAADCTPGQGGE